MGSVLNARHCKNTFSPNNAVLLPVLSIIGGETTKKTENNMKLQPKFSREQMVKIQCS